jgi:hypothetical protein
VNEVRYLDRDSAAPSEIPTPRLSRIRSSYGDASRQSADRHFLRPRLLDEVQILAVGFVELPASRVVRGWTCSHAGPGRSKIDPNGVAFNGIANPSVPRSPSVIHFRALRCNSSLLTKDLVLKEIDNRRLLTGLGRGADTHSTC